MQCAIYRMDLQGQTGRINISQSVSIKSDCKSQRPHLQLLSNAMSSLEHPPHQSEMPIAQPEITLPQSWGVYIRQLGQQFQVEIAHPGAKLRLNVRETQRQLLIVTCPTYVVVSHGQATVEGILPDEEILFDITKDGDLLPSEIMYTPEVWNTFQERLRLVNLPPSDEQSFDGERFADYVLEKIAREEWTNINGPMMVQLAPPSYS